MPFDVPLLIIRMVECWTRAAGFCSILVIAAALVALLFVVFPYQEDGNVWSVNSTVGSIGINDGDKSGFGIVTCLLGTSDNELVHLLGLVRSLSMATSGTDVIVLEVYHDPSSNPISLWMEMQMEESCPSCRISFHPLSPPQEHCSKRIARSSTLDKALHVSLEGPVVLSSHLFSALDFAATAAMPQSSETSTATMMYTLEDLNFGGNGLNTTTAKTTTIRTIRLSKTQDIIATMGIDWDDDSPLWFQGTTRISGLAMRHWMVQDPNCSALQVQDQSSTFYCPWLRNSVFRPMVQAQQDLSMDRSSSIEWVMHVPSTNDSPMVESSVALLRVPSSCKDSCTQEFRSSLKKILSFDKLELVIFEISTSVPEDEVGALDSSSLRLVQTVWDELNRPDLDFALLFQNGENDNLTVIPRQLELFLRQEETSIPFFVRAPSGLACVRLLSWIRTASDWNNRKVAGCLVMLDSEELENSWKEFASHSSNISSTILSSTTQGIYQICDTLATDDSSSLWRKRYKKCMDAGFDVIYTPVPREHVAIFPATEDPGALMGNDFLTNMTETLRMEMQPSLKSMNMTDYLSSWGVAFSPNWKDRTALFFREDHILPAAPAHEVFYKQSIWRCVTKGITVMLLLRLEELGLLDLDRPIARDDDYAIHPLSLRMIVTMSAGNNGELEGKAFAYKNPMWIHVEESVANATGLTFFDAVHHFVVDRMGFSGDYNPNTTFPPMGARGFEGGLDDVLLVGSTLANGGISPKTGKRIVSADSVESMLVDYTAGHKASFFNDHTSSASRKWLTPYGYAAFKNYTGSWEDETDPLWIVLKGYGMGIWLTSSLRTWDASGAIGLGTAEIFLYFDDTGYVFATLSKRVEDVDFWEAFVKILRGVGDFVSEWAGLATT